MGQRGFCTSPLRTRLEDLGMDFVAIVLGIIMFASLLGLILGIERI
jgi:hypothetical protein